jgi:hypothetical protein
MPVTAFSGYRMLLIRVGGLIAIKLPDLFRTVCRHKVTVGFSVNIFFFFMADLSGLETEDKNELFNKTWLALGK